MHLHAEEHFLEHPSKNRELENAHFLILSQSLVS
jgi:hypothetical protein